MSINGVSPRRKEAVERLVEAAVQLLDAARTYGGPGIIEATLFLIGQALTIQTGDPIEWAI